MILDVNGQYFGVPVINMMEKAGRGIADFVCKKFGKNKKIAIVCGLGNNGGDGLVAARYLVPDNQVDVYLVDGKCDHCKTKETRINCERLIKKFKDSAEQADGPSDKLYVNADAKTIQGQYDVVIECLFGVGLKSELHEPHKSVVKKINRLKGKKITVDIAVPGFKTDYTLSTHYAKVKGAHILDLGITKEIEERVGPGEVKALYSPSRDSHKGQNGKLLLIAGSDRFHGAALMAAKMSSKIVDMLFFYSTSENQKLLQKMKSGLCEFITVLPGELDAYAKEANVILIGPGLGISEETQYITELVLKKYKDKKTVLDADSLKVIKPKFLHKNCLIMPHSREFEKLFGKKITQGKKQISLDKRKKLTQQMAKKYGCHIVLKGAEDIICSPKECKINIVGHPGMTKGGTGDVLAGLTAGFACNNDLFLSAKAATFLNGLAGERLAKKVAHYYSATDLVVEVPRAVKWCVDY